MSQGYNSNVKAKCCIKQMPFKQCCCKCIYLRPVHRHCTTEPRPKAGTCVCHIRKGWACIPPGFGGVVYDNWGRHSIGCELYTTKKMAKKMALNLQWLERS